MSEKKVVGRNVAIALGIICIILAAGLVGVIAVYTSQINSLNSEVSDLYSIINLDKYEVWYNETVCNQMIGGTYTVLYPPNIHQAILRYSGYIAVHVLSSTTNNTYVEVIWLGSGNITYDNRITVGTSGYAYFPVLARTMPEIRVGNTNPDKGATETVTITYHY